MQADFWHERWRAGKIGFHQDTVASALKEYWPALDLPLGSEVFIPLCGKSLDMLWLRDRPHGVVGVELSEVALESFCQENGLPVRRGGISGFDQYQTENLRLLRGDFFQLNPGTLGDCPAVYDRAALVSWAPELRKRYVEHVTKLTPVGCQTLLVTVEYPQAQMAGPPFSVDAECVERLYSARHDIRQLHRKDILSTDARMQARGVKQLHEACYHLTRL